MINGHLLHTHLYDEERDHFHEVDGLITDGTFYPYNAFDPGV